MCPSKILVCVVVVVVVVLVALSLCCSKATKQNETMIQNRTEQDKFEQKLNICHRLLCLFTILCFHCSIFFNKTIQKTYLLTYIFVPQLPRGNFAMNTLRSFLVTFALLFMQLPRVSGGKILVFPLDGSHWVNMKILIEELHARGHEVTVIRAADSWYISEQSPLYSAVTVPTSNGFSRNLEASISRQLDLILQRRHQSAWSQFWSHLELSRFVIDQFTVFHKGMCEMIDDMLGDKELMRSLHEGKYDVVLSDPGVGGGAFLARLLKLPLVYNVRWTVQGEAHLVIAPSPMSYIPFTATQFTDRMTFVQRVSNFVRYMIGMRTQFSFIRTQYKPVIEKYFGPDEDFSTFFLDADIWLMRNDFVFEYPRPTMPNIVYMAGFQCKPAKPLPADLEEFVQSSGDHGVIMMTLGTLVGELPQDVTEEIASAFAQMPQKVVWRYLGQRPNSLGNNTLLVKWLPQNDLLGHPKVKAFVTHGGTNGVQEAIYHGVPVVGLPLFFDQPENLSRIKSKGGAVTVDIATLDRNIFEKALRAVVYQPSYAERMQTLSKLHRDQPMKPLELAVFWIEFVIRHKGAGHLQSHSHKMSWCVYHSIDVIAALLSVALLFVFVCFVLVRSMWKCVVRRRKIKPE